MSPEAIREAVIALIAALVFAAGYVVGGWSRDAEIGRLQTSIEKARADGAASAADRLHAAAVTNDNLLAALANADAQRQQLAEEKDRELRRLTTGRRCLDRAAVELLNGSAAQPAVPEAGRQPVPADAAFATDTDVGRWANTCRKQYDTCRSRLDAIGAFYKDQPSD